MKVVVDNVFVIDQGFVGTANIEVCAGPHDTSETIVDIVSDHRMSLVFDKDEFERLIEGLLARHEQMT